MTGGEGEGKPRPRRRRPLAPEEKALWEHVARSVDPLRPKRRALVPAAAPPEPPAPEAAPPEPPAPLAKVKKAVAPSPPKPPLTPLAPLEPKMRRRLSRGGTEVDARLDLHGMTQAAAHGRLISFLRVAQTSGHSLVLVITGKGDATAGFHAEGGRGVLRRLVPQWLAAPELRMVVVGFETAARGHGGEGALYVRVRRVREGVR